MKRAAVILGILSFAIWAAAQTGSPDRPPARPRQRRQARPAPARRPRQASTAGQDATRIRRLQSGGGHHRSAAPGKGSGRFRDQVSGQRTARAALQERDAPLPECQQRGKDRGHGPQGAEPRWRRSRGSGDRRRSDCRENARLRHRQGSTLRRSDEDGRESDYRPWTPTSRCPRALRRRRSTPTRHGCVRTHIR